jgi:hypothetical protein
MISKIMGHPTLGGMLRLVNPLLARMARSPEPAEIFSPEESMAETGTPV